MVATTRKSKAPADAEEKEPLPAPGVPEDTSPSTDDAAEGTTNVQTSLTIVKGSLQQSNLLVWANKLSAEQLKVALKAIEPTLDIKGKKAADMKSLLTCYVMGTKYVTIDGVHRAVSDALSVKDIQVQCMRCQAARTDFGVCSCDSDSPGEVLAKPPSSGGGTATTPDVVREARCGVCKAEFGQHEVCMDLFCEEARKCPGCHAKVAKDHGCATAKCIYNPCKFCNAPRVNGSPCGKVKCKEADNGWNKSGFKCTGCGAPVSSMTKACSSCQRANPLLEPKGKDGASSSGNVTSRGSSDDSKTDIGTVLPPQNCPCGGLQANASQKFCGDCGNSFRSTCECGAAIGLSAFCCDCGKQHSAKRRRDDRNTPKVHTIECGLCRAPTTPTGPCVQCHFIPPVGATSRSSTVPADFLSSGNLPSLPSNSPLSRSYIYDQPVVRSILSGLTARQLGDMSGNHVPLRYFVEPTNARREAYLLRGKGTGITVQGGQLTLAASTPKCLEIASEKDFFDALARMFELDRVFHPGHFQAESSLNNHLRELGARGISWKTLYAYVEHARQERAMKGNCEPLFPIPDELTRKYITDPLMYANVGNMGANTGNIGVNPAKVNLSGGGQSKKKNSSKSQVPQLSGSEKTTCFNHDLCLAFQRGMCNDCAAGGTHPKTIRGRKGAAPTVKNLKHSCLKCLNSAFDAKHTFVSCPN